MVIVKCYKTFMVITFFHFLLVSVRGGSGPTTFSITTLSITTFSMTTFGITID